MNILIANTQEFNPQIGGVERVSTILAKEFQQLGHKVYFLACSRSPYSKEYTPVVPQKMLSNLIEYNTATNINELCAFLEENEIDTVYQGKKIMIYDIEGVQYYLLPSKSITTYHKNIEHYWQIVNNDFRPVLFHIHLESCNISIR